MFYLLSSSEAECLLIFTVDAVRILLEQSIVEVDIIASSRI